MTRMRKCLVTIGATLGLTGCSLPIKRPYVSLDQLPVSQFYSPTSPIGPESYPNEQTALVRGMKSQAEAKGYRVLDHRIFVFVGHVREISPQWVVLHADLWAQFKNSYHAKEVANYISTSEPAASAVWRLSDGCFIAVAQSRPLPDGTALVGYFSLEVTGSAPVRPGPAQQRLPPSVPETEPAAP